jgi:mono/diheme cytochrome c family protein
MIIPMILALGFLIMSSPAKAQTIPTDQTLILEGKKIYLQNCVRCHNTNPHKAGSIGPDLYSTPEEVFHTKVPNGKYPKGYTPKRKSRVMPRFKHLTERVDLIYSYIRSIKK